MKTRSQLHVTAIQAANAEEFNKKINAELMKRESPKITYIQGLPFAAYVEYMETVEIPESLREKYELNGDGRHCRECPYFVRTQDKRYKWHYCAQKQKKVTECQGACETYYQLLEEMIRTEVA